MWPVVALLLHLLVDVCARVRVCVRAVCSCDAGLTSGVHRALWAGLSCGASINVAGRTRLVLAPPALNIGAVTKEHAAISFA